MNDQSTDVTTSSTDLPSDTRVDLTGDGTASLDAADLPTDPAPFVPDYTPADATRVQRVRLRFNDGGVATATFRGQVDGATRDLWVEADNGGRVSLYAEVVCDDDSATEVKVAKVPTGKRVPNPSQRLGTTRRGSSVRHFFLVSLDGSVSRTAYEDEQTRRRAARDAQRALDALDADGGDAFDF